MTTRILDFTSTATPWHRRLWGVGSFLALEELHEAGQWVEKKVISSGAIDWQKHALERMLGSDKALGDSVRRKELQNILRGDLSIASGNRRRLRNFIDVCQPGYLERWADHVGQDDPPRAELLARSVAAHLLDHGHSFTGVQRWIRDGRRDISALELVREAAKLADQQIAEWEVFVPFVELPGHESLAVHLGHWSPRSNLPAWLDLCGYKLDDSHKGGFTYKIEARDYERAIEIADDMVERLKARSRFARLKGSVIPAHDVYVKGVLGNAPLRSGDRGAQILSLQSEKVIYAVGLDVQRTGTEHRNFIDDALEVAATLNSGALAPAISGSWAALESLLTEPRDDTEKGKVVAAQRAAQLVACSWTRAELTAIAHQLRSNKNDSTAKVVERLSSNRERAEYIASLIDADGVIPLKRTWRLRSDVAAIERMREVIRQPNVVLGRVKFYLEYSLRGLYRARNIVVHGGSTGGVSLPSTLRVTAPLVGAALDRISHAYFANGTSPLTLATRAEFSLDHAGDELGPHICRLLE
ncbi:hypothetical protein ACFUNF_12365 [Streptomyces sp. NPDC057291]|uniref:hypothetical protein n=1 Tax=Streptomyces sp. NPDC057291 TaxID=3346087 RepID=UPI00363BB09E